MSKIHTTDTKGLYLLYLLYLPILYLRYSPTLNFNIEYQGSQMTKPYISHLWRHVLCAADGRLEERRGDGLVHARAEVKVAQLDGPRSLGVDAQHVLGLLTDKGKCSLGVLYSGVRII